MRRKEEWKEGKNNLRSNPGLILPSILVPNSHPGGCSPGHTTQLAQYDGWILPQGPISAGPLVAAAITGKCAPGTLL